MNKTDLNLFHANYDTVTGVVLFFVVANLHSIRVCTRVCKTCYILTNW